MEIWKRNLYVCWLGSFLTSSALSQVAPILPIYIRELGVTDVSSAAMWVGFAFGSTTLMMTFFSPIWGKLADEYGRKPMLLRASLGMAVVLALTAFVDSVWQLVGLRLLMGVISGYNSGAITLIATETPREKSGWALGTLATGAVSGQLIGPLLGGYLAEAAGVRENFLIMAFLLGLNFILSLTCIREEFTRPVKSSVKSLGAFWRTLDDPAMLTSMFVTTFFVMMTLFVVQPVLTIYIAVLAPETDHLALLSGLTFAASGVSAILAAPRLGRLSDRIGAQKVLCAALAVSAVLFVPQGLVTDPWQLIVLRFFAGIATGAMLPSINTLLRQHIAASAAGRVFSLNQSAQFLGTFCGSVLGGHIAAWFGIQMVFFAVAFISAANAVFVYWWFYRRFSRNTNQYHNGVD